MTDQPPLKNMVANFNLLGIFLEKTSPFIGISYAPNNKILIKLETDNTLTPGEVGYEIAESDFSFGVDFAINNNFTIGVANERNNYLSMKFIYKNNSNAAVKKYQYKKSDSIKSKDDKYRKLIKNIENNGIGVNKVIETSDSIGLELTQFIHPNIETIEDIITSAKIDAGINKSIKKDIELLIFRLYQILMINFLKILNCYMKEKIRNFYTKNNFVIRPFLAAREEFFKGALLIENNSEYIIQDNFFFSSNIKYSLADNFDDLTIPPVNTFPAQVRSDIKDYLRNIDGGIIIGRAQFDYHITPKKYHHIMLTGGILEDMFSGLGGEYLYFNNSSNYAFGLEVFKVKKRDYKMKFGTLDYENITHSVNFIIETITIYLLI